jgi:hypothetical protein
VAFDLRSDVEERAGELPPHVEIPLLNVRIRRARNGRIETLPFEFGQQLRVVRLWLNQAIGEGIAQRIQRSEATVVGSHHGGGGGVNWRLEGRETVVDLLRRYPDQRVSTADDGIVQRAPGEAETRGSGGFLPSPTDYGSDKPGNRPAPVGLSDSFRPVD